VLTGPPPTLYVKFTLMVVLELSVLALLKMATLRVSPASMVNVLPAIFVPHDVSMSETPTTQLGTPPTVMLLIVTVADCAVLLMIEAKRT
jgi:hypothetical protein